MRGRGSGSYREPLAFRRSAAATLARANASAVAEAFLARPSPYAAATAALLRLASRRGGATYSIGGAIGAPRIFSMLEPGRRLNSRRWSNRSTVVLPVKILANCAHFPLRVITVHSIVYRTRRR